MDDCQLHLSYVRNTLLPDIRSKTDKCSPQTPDESRSLCIACDDITPWEIQDQGEDHLRPYMFDRPPRRLMWERAWVHPWCAPPPGDIWAPKHKELDTYVDVKKSPTQARTLWPNTPPLVRSGFAARRSLAHHGGGLLAARLILNRAECM